jgi:hypothetical protein
MPQAMIADTEPCRTEMFIKYVPAGEHTAALEAQTEAHEKAIGIAQDEWLDKFVNLRSTQGEEIEKLQREVEDLKEALYPFGLYATALKGREPMNTVHRIGHQAITAGAFQDARETLKLDETPPKEKDK